MMSNWYGDWQSLAHVAHFDGRAGLDRRNLIRNFEGFNDVRLLNERYGRGEALDLLELGSATGEFYRYLRIQYPGVRYTGTDISAPAVARAKAKYPQGSFFVIDSSVPLPQALRAVDAPAHPRVVYAKDVIPHQPKPLTFITELVQVASEAVIIRARTRDAGWTEWDPERSCQYHYNGWMPYIVLNVQEMLDHIADVAPRSEVVIYRSHVVLGGHNDRFVPKDLYLRETGTAETAVGIFLKTTYPGRVIIEDRPDHRPRYTWDYLLKHAARQALNVFRRPPDGDRQVQKTRLRSAAERDRASDTSQTQPAGRIPPGEPRS